MSNQKIAMGEKIVKNNAMDEQLLENSVTDAKIDPKVVMDPFVFKIGGWHDFTAH